MDKLPINESINFSTKMHASVYIAVIKEFIRDTWEITFRVPLIIDELDKYPRAVPLFHHEYELCPGDEVMVFVLTQADPTQCYYVPITLYKFIGMKYGISFIDITKDGIIDLETENFYSFAINNSEHRTLGKSTNISNIAQFDVNNLLINVPINKDTQKDDLIDGREVPKVEIPETELGRKVDHIVGDKFIRVKGNKNNRLGTVIKVIDGLVESTYNSKDDEKVTRKINVKGSQEVNVATSNGSLGTSVINAEVGHTINAGVPVDTSDWLNNENSEHDWKEDSDIDNKLSSMGITPSSLIEEPEPNEVTSSKKSNQLLGADNETAGTIKLNVLLKGPAAPGRAEVKCSLNILGNKENNVINPTITPPDEKGNVVKNTERTYNAISIGPDGIDLRVRTEKSTTSDGIFEEKIFDVDGNLLYKNTNNGKASIKKVGLIESIIDNETKKISTTGANSYKTTTANSYEYGIQNNSGKYIKENTLDTQINNQYIGALTGIFRIPIEFGVSVDNSNNVVAASDYEPKTILVLELVGGRIIGISVVTAKSGSLKGKTANSSNIYIDNVNTIKYDTNINNKIKTDPMSINYNNGTILSMKELKEIPFSDYGLSENGNYNNFHPYILLNDSRSANVRGIKIE